MMIRSTCLIFTISVIAASAVHAQPFAAPVELREAFPEILPAESAAPPVQPWTPLTLDRMELFQEGVNVRELGPLTDAEIVAADQRAAERYHGVQPAPPRTGLTRSMQPQLIRVPGADVTAIPLDNGKSLWTLVIRSPDAQGIRLHFTGFDVGTSELIIYAARPEGPVVRGPFTGRGPQNDGEFWSPSIPGDSAVIEIIGQDEPRFEIAEILHRDRDPNPPGPGGGGCDSDCLDNSGDECVCPCHLDVMCFGDPPVDTGARDATGQMVFVKDGEEFVCSGTLLADMDPYTSVPYFITANHCIDSQEVLNTLEVTWFFQSNGCSGIVPNPDTLPRNFDGVMLHTSGYTFGNDATFVRLNGSLPAGIGFAGWTTNEQIGDVSISHPKGSFKRAAFAHYVSNFSDCGTGCGCPAPANYALYHIDDGIIQGGSSGSGMFTTGGQLIGQLFGTCSLCPDANDCLHTGDWCMVYGEFAQTLPDIDHWLVELGGTIHVDDSNPSPPWDGTPANPYPTVAQGEAALWEDGLRMVVHAGNYPETPTFNRRVTITGSGGLARIGNLP